MVSSAALCFSGVTPAQQEASTVIRTSGIAAFSSSALETTQISVQSPTSSISYRSGILFRSSAKRMQPNMGFS